MVDGLIDGVGVGGMVEGEGSLGLLCWDVSDQHHE